MNLKIKIYKISFHKFIKNLLGNFFLKISGGLINFFSIFSCGTWLFHAWTDKAVFQQENKQAYI